MPNAYPIRLLDEESPLMYLEALSLSEYSAPQLHPYTFGNATTCTNMAQVLRDEGYTVEALNGSSFRTDADSGGVLFASLLLTGAVAA